MILACLGLPEVVVVELKRVDIQTQFLEAEKRQILEFRVSDRQGNGDVLFEPILQRGDDLDKGRHAFACDLDGAGPLFLVLAGAGGDLATDGAVEGRARGQAEERRQRRAQQRQLKR